MEANKTRLRVFSLSMVVLSLVIGMGIFKTASVSAASALNPNIFFIAWIFGGLIAFCGALTYAEIGARMPVTGGYYKIFSVAYHPSVAFAMNGMILVTNAASLGGVALIGADYLFALLGVENASNDWKALIAMGIILLFYLINLRGLRVSSIALNVLMMVKLGLLLTIVLAIFFSGGQASESLTPQTMQDTDFSSWIWSFGATLVAVCFTYGGYQHTINFGEEVEQPRHTLPRGIFIGIAIVIVFYVLVNYSYFRVIGFDELKTTQGVASVVVQKIFGNLGERIFTVLLVIALLTYVNVNLLSNPRIMYAMSLDGVLPGAFTKKSQKYQVLTHGLTFFALASIAITFFAETFDRILGFVMILDSLGMAASAATLFYLRKRTTQNEDEGKIFSIGFYPWVPLFFITAYLFVGISCIYMNPSYGLIAAAVVLVLWVLYFFIRKMSGDSVAP